MINKCLILFMGFVLMACEQKIQTSYLDEIRDSKAKAQGLIEKKSFDTNSMLEIQSYFFSFYEKLNLLKLNSDKAENLKQSFAKISTSTWCDNLILSESTFRSLDTYCRSQKVSKCSFEMLDYERLIKAIFVFLEKNNYKVKDQCGYK